MVIRLISARKADPTRYAAPPLQIAEEIWVVHAFQKKPTQGAKTPQRGIDLISDRLKRLKEMLR